jgi:tRNA(Ile)-lysidine synthase
LKQGSNHLALANSWINQLIDYRVLYVGFSGGIDSSVLLHLLAKHPATVEKIHAVHVHHGLSSHATEWEQHCQRFCDFLGVPLSTHRVEILKTSNLEEQARLARYEVFHSLLTSADGLLLAHHEDDQAETLLLNLMRGAGVDGLAAMEPIQPLFPGVVLRPLLTSSRQMIESYARHHQLTWVEDESNQNVHFSRNYLRHHIIPLLEKKWPAATRTIARSAMHCQAAQKNLEALANIDCNALSTESNRLSILDVKDLPRERMANALRSWLKKNNQQAPNTNVMNRLIDDVIFARDDSEPRVTFGNCVIRRFREQLYCLDKHLGPLQPIQNLASVIKSTPDIPSPPWGSSFVETMSEAKNSFTWSTFPSPMKVNNGWMVAALCKNGFHVPKSSCIQVRFRNGGELFRWHGQTKALKKLLQQWQIPPWLRDTIPLIYVDDVLAVVVGYAVSDEFYNSQKPLLNSFRLGFAWGSGLSGLFEKKPERSLEVSSRRDLFVVDGVFNSDSE